jgi:hypothetical protein
VLDVTLRALGTHHATQGSPSAYAYFTACVRRNLRVAVSMDPASEAFVPRLQQSPALTACCSVLWWAGWAAGSLQAMAAAKLTAPLAAAGCAEVQQDKLLADLLHIHASAEQQLAATPRHFLSCAELYARALGLQQAQLLQQQRFLKVCVRVCVCVCARFWGSVQTCWQQP